MTVDLQDASDRVLEAARLFRVGKVKHILVAAGNLPWAVSSKPEALTIVELLLEFGVPREAIEIEDQSRNTYENAINSVPILRRHDWRSALLVTSGFHMPRALAVFERAGINVVPAATDIRVTYPIYSTVLDFLPEAGALARTTDAVKELAGLFVYRLRGWA